MKLKSVAAIEKTAEVSNNRSTGKEQDNSNFTEENDSDIIQVEDITMDGE